jgi:hypothetical protein
MPRHSAPIPLDGHDAVDSAHLEADRRLLQTMAVALLIPAIGFIANDLPFTPARPLWQFVAVRVLMVSCLLGVLVWVGGARDRSTLERRLFPLTALVLTSQLLLRLLRPPDGLQPTTFEVVSVLVMYASFPLSLPRLLQLLLPFTAVSVGMTLFWVEGPTLAMRGTVAVTLVIANLLGSLITRNRLRLLRDLASARDAQARALAELRTLRGIIPVCSGCSSVRVDDDQWQALQSYVAARTDAEFSHGLCPACQHRLYPELFDEAAPRF